MKLKITLILIFLTGICNAQIINIPDVHFKAILLLASPQNNYAKNYNGESIEIDVNNNGEIELTETLPVRRLNINSIGAEDLIGIKDFINLKSLYCDYNSISNLDVSGMSSLEYLLCRANQMENLNINGLNNLISLKCGENQLTTIDASTLTSLQTLNCYNNNLQSLFIKNGMNEDLSAIGNFNLRYVCADDSQIEFITTHLNQSFIIPCAVNSYCSFTQGGTYYTITGSNKFDIDNNGCNSTDLIVPQVKLNITNGITTGKLIPNFDGNYSLTVGSGTHTITPILENPSYFNVTPLSTTVTFPATASPAIRNFCYTANGTHNDLEVALLPTTNARPGFDTQYKLVYKNKGTNSQSGTINLTFNDSVLDLISAFPISAVETVNNLTWNFSNLLPFETREILITLNLNSPSETPSVNSGFLLNYTTTIAGLSDETPLDNLKTLNQIVTNSFDPNDKNCLEGLNIPIDKVGDFVHYIIRFENSGTANAQNIVVKDIINTSKFDISTIVPISGSNPFFTKIREFNQVEFIFENINLPFDDLNNDGYVSFKIRTIPSLVLGNTFSNTASIYFDYNLPIITNNYTTTIQSSLGNSQFSSDNFSIFPNPIKDILNFNVTDIVLKIEVYDISGRILSSNSVSENKVDLSGLKTGNYIIKLYTKNGITNTKIIKE